MVLDIKNIYSFDEVSIIHQCVFKITPAHVFFFKGKDTLIFPNYYKLKELGDSLKKEKIPKYKFVPSEFVNNAIVAVTQLIGMYMNPAFMPESLRADFIRQFEEYKEALVDYDDIEKDENIDDIKEIFKKNPIKLKKGTTLPNADDLKSIKRLMEKSCNGIKFIISEDEDFWGYKALIKKEFGIDVVEEWKCHFLCR